MDTQESSGRHTGPGSAWFILAGIVLAVVLVNVGLELFLAIH